MKRAAFLTICPLMALGTLSLFGVSALDLFSPTSAQSPTEAAPQPLPDHAVARIGDDLVYADEVLERVQELEISRQLPADKQLVGPAYEYAINTRLLQLEATRLQILCTDSDKKNETDKHIERLKLKVKQDFGGQISWENYLKQRGLTHEELYEQIYEKAELIVLRRRLVHYWEMTTTGAQILSIRCESKTVADRILAAIDDEILKGKEVKATFNKHAVLNTSHNESPLQYAFIESPIPDVLHKAIFTDLSVGKYSSVLKINDNDYRLVYLDTKHVREARPFKDLQKLIDEEPAIDNDDRYRRWVNAVYKSGRYRVQFRFPGRDTITTATEHDIAKSNEVKDKGGKPQR